MGYTITVFWGTGKNVTILINREERHGRIAKESESVLHVPLFAESARDADLIISIFGL